MGLGKTGNTKYIGAFSKYDGAGVPLIFHLQLGLTKIGWHEGRYSVDAVLKTVLLQTHSNRSDVCK